MGMSMNTKEIIKLVMFKLPKDDFHHNEYSDIDKYIDNVVNGCPVYIMHVRSNH